MSGNVSICEIPAEIKEKLAKFRMRKDNNIAAIVLKIDADNLKVIEDEEYEDVTIEEIVNDLPEHLPRYVVLSYVYNHGDGRVSYPLIFVYVNPAGTKPELHMMYAGTKLEVQNSLQLTKTFEVRELEEFTDEWLQSKMAFYK